MFEFDSGRKNSHDDSIEIPDRTRRALERAATVLHTDGTPIGAGDNPTMVAVESGNSGREHTVDVREDRCTCEDHRHRGAECYHLRRAKIALGVRTVATAELAAADVDSQLAEHAPGPVVATSDGGIIDAGDEGEVLDDEGDTDTDTDDVADDGCPDDCDCGAWNADADLPCWPCYREGFEEPASADQSE